MIGIIGLKAEAEEKTIDATQTSPYTYTIPADETGIIVPISFSKMGVYTYKIQVSNFSNEVHADLLKDLRGENWAAITGFNGTEKEYTRIVEEPVTYYLFIYSENPPAVEKTVTVNCTYNVPETEGRAISEGEEVRSVGMDTLSYSFKLSKDSKVHIVGDHVSLCDSAKENLSISSINNKMATAYLKKGTYYLSVPYGGIHTFKYTTEKITFSNNTTKKKAKTIKLGKSVKMKFYATNKEEAPLYYKFTLKKAKKISVTGDLTKLHSLGTMNVYIFKKNANTVPYMHGYIDGQKKGKIKFMGSLKKGMENFFADKKSIKLPAGTYYLVVDNTSGGDAAITVK